MTEKRYSFRSLVFLLPQARLPDLYIDEIPYKQLPETVFPLPEGTPHRWAGEVDAAELLVLLVNPQFVAGIAVELNVPGFLFCLEALYCDFEIHQLISYLKRELCRNQAGRSLVLKPLEQLLIVHLIRIFAESGKSGRFQRKAAVRQNIRGVMDFMNKSYNQDLTLHELAEAANLSPFYFIRVFREETGKTPFDFLMEIRLSKSLDMVRNEGNSISEICYSNGFINVSHFSRLFKKKYGCSPLAFRKSNYRKN